MKVAIVHDYIKEYGGAERVLEELLKLYPKADVYTALYAPRFLGPHRDRFEKYKIHQSFFRFIPFAYKLISPLRILSPMAFSSFELSNYDVVIVSQTGAYFPNMVRTGGACVHICYTHTPPRYLYGYMTARDWKKNPVVRSVAEFVNHFLRLVDYYSSRRVDVFVANSEEVKRRIEKFYRREALVVYPPVVGALESKSRHQDKKGYFLAGGRLARAKGMDVIVDAFLKNGKPLKIFGKGFAGFEEELLAKIQVQNTNIEFVGEVSDVEKLELMRDSDAYIFASFDEDFGITPVEAMGQGTPVIAYKSGGVVETVEEGKTGLFYSPNTVEALNACLTKMEKLAKVRGGKIAVDCVARAEKFSDRVFDEKMKSVVHNSLL